MYRRCSSNGAALFWNAEQRKYLLRGYGREELMVS